MADEWPPPPIASFFRALGGASHVKSLPRLGAYGLLEFGSSSHGHVCVPAAPIHGRGSRTRRRLKSMKRLLLGVVIFGGAALLGGCPIYPGNHSYQVCNDCCTSADCGPGSSCSPQGFCVADSDASTSSGPCGICAAGTECTLA